MIERVCESVCVSICVCVCARVVFVCVCVRVCVFQSIQWEWGIECVCAYCRECVRVRIRESV